MRLWLQRSKSIDELKALMIDGRTVADLIVEEVGKTGEKMEIGAYEYVEAPSTTSYNHLGNKLSTIVGFNLEGVVTRWPVCGQQVAL